MFAEGSEGSEGAKSFVSVADKFVEEIQLSIKSSSVFGERDCSISSSGCLKNEESESKKKEEKKFPEQIRNFLGQFLSLARRKTTSTHKKKRISPFCKPRFIFSEEPEDDLDRR